LQETQGGIKLNSLKTKYYLLLFSGIFAILFLFFINTDYAKYILAGIASLLGGIYSRLDNKDNPRTLREKIIFSKGTIAWFMLIIGGIWLIFYATWEIIRTGIW
jgi:hypothetical protein